MTELEQIELEQINREIARRQSARQAESQQPSIPGTIARQGAQGLTFGFGDEIQGAGGALRAAITPGVTIVEGYRNARDIARRENNIDIEQRPVLSAGSQLVGGATSLLIPGGGVAKGAMTAAKLAKTGGAGVAIGGASGLGGSNADLTRGEVGQAAKDTATGAAVGGVIGAAAQPVAKGLGSALGSMSEKLAELGETRLFKAAVGQTKRAFTQMDGKGLLDKAGKYLDAMGIGFGDTTESIAQKLAVRKESIGQALGDTVSALDSAAGSVPKISPSNVAKRIVDEVAEPLKKLAAARSEYKQVMAEAKAILKGSSGKIRKNITFSEAVEQRSAAQKQVNYDAQNGRDIAAQARREIAQIWNEEIDKESEWLLTGAGKAKDTYRELRQEYSLVSELGKHVNNRAQGNAANRVLSPSDYGIGGVAGIMSGNPVVGVAGAIANHIGRNYGNAAAGRTALNMARAASMSSEAAKRFLPASFMAARGPMSMSVGQNDENNIEPWEQK